MKHLELLSPAKNAEQGKAAIDHGADALYIGAPAFGARHAAGNSIEDIESLVKYGHLFGSKIYTTVNTLLFDNDIEDANKLIHQLYNIGVDAIILQDLGLLETDLPPIAIHASTQTHNIDPRRVQFLQDVGFQRVILARETSIEQIKNIHKQCNVELEGFIQGALCVCYSGQCYMSQYLNERSGNRGCCSQPCRSSYSLYNDQNKLLKKEEHLLSLKDFSAAQHIGSMIDAGITSFKIEGRLKDISYVKNVTAFYRQLLDNLMENREDCTPASIGKCKYYFTPDLEKTFNRGFTSYFLEKRQLMASLSTQKSLGKYLGKVTHISPKGISIATQETLSCGDGLCYFDEEGTLQGFLINHVENNFISPNKPQNIASGTKIWRNNDYSFEKKLQNQSAERKIGVILTLQENEEGYELLLHDEENIVCSIFTICEKQVAKNPGNSNSQILKQLSKIGDTPFAINDIHILLSQPYFIPISTLNEMRREGVRELMRQRINAHYPQDIQRIEKKVDYFEQHLDYKANIINTKSRDFYLHHGVTQYEMGLEYSHEYENKALMTTKYCIRYELGECLKCKNNTRISPDYKGQLFLKNNKKMFRLEFDCQNCEMKIFPHGERLESGKSDCQGNNEYKKGGK